MELKGRKDRVLARRFGCVNLPVQRGTTRTKESHRNSSDVLRHQGVPGLPAPQRFFCCCRGRRKLQGRLAQRPVHLPDHWHPHDRRRGLLCLHDVQDHALPGCANQQGAEGAGDPPSVNYHATKLLESTVPSSVRIGRHVINDEVQGSWQPFVVLRIA
jgi:hypothetical protein